LGSGVCGECACRYASNDGVVRLQGMDTRFPVQAGSHARLQVAEHADGRRERRMLKSDDPSVGRGKEGEARHPLR